MEKILDVAQFVYSEFLKLTSETIDEMKLHKLLYFAQRESLAITNKPLFEEEMQGWIHGPVSPLVRGYFLQEVGIYHDTKPIQIESERILKNVIAEYGHVSSWKLRELSHQEISWIRSREGLKPHERGNKPLKIDDIREDAKKVRPFDSTWGMYYDEFPDSENEGEWF